MKIFIKLIVLAAIAIIFFLIGNNHNSDPVEKYDSVVNSDLEAAVKNYPRGVLNIPAQWFMMESSLGWEKMMFVFGYADNKDTCYHLVDIAKIESPERNFRCEDAN